MAGKAQLLGVRLDQMLIIRSVRLVAAGTHPLLECLMDALVFHPLGQVPVTGQAELLGILNQQGSFGGEMCLMAGQAFASGSRRMSEFLSPLIIHLCVAHQADILRGAAKLRFFSSFGKGMTHIALTIHEGRMCP